MNAKELVLKYHNAFFNQRDRAAVRALLSDKGYFAGPLSSYTDADAFLNEAALFMALTRSAEIKKVFADGDEVCVIYDFVTDTTVGAVPSVEWLTLEGGRIRSIRLIFHTQPWPAVLEELARRAGGTA